MRTAAQRLEAIWYGHSAWRWLLWPASLVFRLLVRLRAEAYRRRFLRSVTLPVPVIVVGNITVGGTGKTPFIIWLARQLRQRGLSVGIVSRGYRGRSPTWPRRVTPETDPDEVGDEPVLLAARTGCPVAAGPDRLRAAELLLSETPVAVLLSDDGLQHYRMARSFEIAIVDGARGVGNGLCLPAGPLREPDSRLRSVDAVVVNDGIDTVASEIGPGAARSAGTQAVALGGTTPFRMMLAATHVYRLVDGERAALSDFAGQSVHAVAGIGHPERFFRLLEHAGLEVVRHPLPDHASIRPEDLRYTQSMPVLVTEKDAVKCRSIAHRDVWSVAVDVTMAPDESERLMRSLLGRLMPANSPRR